MKNLSKSCTPRVGGGLGEHQDLVVDEVGLVLQQYVLLGHGSGEEVGTRWEPETRLAWDRIGGEEERSAWAGLR